MGAFIRARFYSNFPPRGSKKKNCPPLRPLVQQDREARGQSASPGVRTCPPLFAAPLSALLSDLLRPLSPSFTAAPPPPLAAASLAGFSLSLLLLLLLFPLLFFFVLSPCFVCPSLIPPPLCFLSDPYPSEAFSAASAAVSPPPLLPLLLLRSFSFPFFFRPLLLPSAPQQAAFPFKRIF